SRGHLVKNYLEGNLNPEKYLAGLVDKSAYYNGFNLLLGTQDSLYYYSNREKVIRELDSGIYGLSNGLLNDPWPKVTKGINMLDSILKDEEVKIESLFTMMTDREQFPDNLLPKTGVSMEWERILAPLFVISPEYGTRVTTVILVDRDNNIRFWERGYIDRQPDNWEEVYYEIGGTDS
ncbi:MAG: NRDE family protein, partial [Syntrophomonadaceae bacterium]|nr:NRDE family protein [Syntrophomonadaceae bacterium]